MAKKFFFGKAKDTPAAVEVVQPVVAEVVEVVEVVEAEVPAPAPTNRLLNKIKSSTVSSAMDFMNTPMEEIEAAIEEGEESELEAAITVLTRETLAGLTDIDAPIREYDFELTADMKQFVSLLDEIYDTLTDADLFGNVVRNIMSELQEQQQYKKTITDSDIHYMMSGLRHTMGMQKIKKEIKAAPKAKKSTTRKQSAKQLKDEEALAMASSLGIDFDDD